MQNLLELRRSLGTKDPAPGHIALVQPELNGGKTSRDQIAAIGQHPEATRHDGHQADPMEGQRMRRSSFLTVSYISFVFALALFARPSLAIDQVLFVNPDMKGRIAGRAYQARDSSYRMRVPDLGSKVFVKDQDITKGVTALSQFLSQELGSLYVVSTKIRDDLPKDDSILPRVASRYQKIATAYPTVFSQRYSRGKYGKVFEFTLINARADGMYPLQIGYQAATQVETLALHRFFVAGGYLFEFALLVHTKGVMQGLSLEELNSKATLVMNEAMDGFSPVVAR